MIIIYLQQEDYEIREVGYEMLGQYHSYPKQKQNSKFTTFTRNKTNNKTKYNVIPFLGQPGAAWKD